MSLGEVEIVLEFLGGAGDEAFLPERCLERFPFGWTQVDGERVDACPRYICLAVGRQRARMGHLPVLQRLIEPGLIHHGFRDVMSWDHRDGVPGQCLLDLSECDDRGISTGEENEPLRESHSDLLKKTAQHIGGTFHLGDQEKPRTVLGVPHRGETETRRTVDRDPASTQIPRDA